jgi:hypothetical protein
MSFRTSCAPAGTAGVKFIVRSTKFWLIITWRYDP